MNSLTPLTPFENKIKQSLAQPDLPADFKAGLRAKISANPTARSATRRPIRWVYALAPLMLLLAVVFDVGPHDVWAQIQKLFGFLPGHGLVDQTKPLRVLAEPVSQTKQGITVEVNSALLTASETTIEYRVLGLTRANYPLKEEEAGCLERPHLILPDGSDYRLDDQAFPPLSEFIDQAKFVLPCLPNTLRSNTPLDWEFDLRFTPSDSMPPLLTVENLPTPPVTEPALSPLASLTLSQAIETARGYILTGWTETNPVNQQLLMQPSLTDAAGKSIATFYPEEMNQLYASEPLSGKRDPFVIAFNSEKIAFPVTISQEYYPISMQSDTETAHFSVDVGQNLQPNQRFEVNQAFELGGLKLVMKEIRAIRETGYQFTVETPPNVNSLDIFIDGHRVIGGGGGGGTDLTANPETAQFQYSFEYAQRPTGVLNITIAGVKFYEAPVTIQTTWQPLSPHAAYPADLHGTGPCLVGSTADEISNLPKFTENYRLVSRGLDPQSGSYALMLNSNTSKPAMRIAQAGASATLSPDGSKLIHTQDGNITSIFITNLTDNTSTQLDWIGSDSRWSPDEKYIAAIANSDSKVLYPKIFNLQDQTSVDLTDYNYAALAGWSQDSQTLYFVTPFLGSPAWKVMAYSLNEKAVIELFTIEDATPKALRPDLSPDGQWLTYRAQDNSSLMLVNMLDQSARVLLEKANVRNARWLDKHRLAVSTAAAGPDFNLVIVDINDCRMNQVEGQLGELVDIQLIP